MPMEPGRPRPASNPTKLFMRCLLSVAENSGDLFDRVPIARGCWHTEELLDPAEVADRFHLAAIDAQNESVLDRDDLEQPVVVRRQAERKRRERARSFV